MLHFMCGSENVLGRTNLSIPRFAIAGTVEMREAARITTVGPKSDINVLTFELNNFDFLTFTTNDVVTKVTEAILSAANADTRLPPDFVKFRKMLLDAS